LINIYNIRDLKYNEEIKKILKEKELKQKEFDDQEQDKILKELRSMERAKELLKI